MKQFNCWLLLSALSMACSASDETEVQMEARDRSPAVLIDSVHWNGETLSFFDATDEDGVPGVVLEVRGRDREPELQGALESQFGRVMTAAEIWLAAGGTMEDLPAELLTAHEMQARLEGRPVTLERPELDPTRVEEKAISQATFNLMFALTSDVTGIAPPQPGQPPLTSACWDALITETKIQGQGIAAKRVCSGNGNAVVAFNQFGQTPDRTNCDPVLNLDATVRTAVFNPSRSSTGGAQPGLNVVQCFATRSNAESCNPVKLIGAGAFLGQTFFKNGVPHRLGTGGKTVALGANNDIDLGSGTLRFGGVPAFQSTTCVQH